MKKKNVIRNSIGVWMDHKKAIIIDPGRIEPVIETIDWEKTEGNITGKEADYARVGHFRASNNEFHKHQREENELHKFYQAVAELLKGYDGIYVFGPTTAPNEFCNYLAGQKAFSGKTIISEKEDYLSSKQIIERVKNYMHQYHF